MKPGPRPLPNNVHALRGNPSKRPPRLEAKLPQADGPLAAPVWLSTPAKAAWRSVVPVIERAWPDFLSPVDVPALALMFEHYATAMEAAKAMRTPRGRGELRPEPIDTDPSHSDRRRKNPAAQVFKEATAAYLQIAREYGLTAVSRIGLDLSGLAAFGATGDDGDDLFND